MYIIKWTQVVAELHILLTDLPNPAFYIFIENKKVAYYTEGTGTDCCTPQVQFMALVPTVVWVWWYADDIITMLLCCKKWVGTLNIVQTISTLIINNLKLS